MWHNRAQINSPDVIKEFRIQVVKFNSSCRQAVAGIHGDSQRIAHWLRYGQVEHWKQEVKKRDELVIQARSAYALAKDSVNVYGKSSCVDEQRALRRAQARKEEAEQKLVTVKKWLMLVEREADKLMGPVNQLSSTLDSATPRALAKLDLLTESLEEYLRQSPDSGPV